jgi:hypothetical protein
MKTGGETLKWVFTDLCCLDVVGAIWLTVGSGGGAFMATVTTVCVAIELFLCICVWFLDKKNVSARIRRRPCRNSFMTHKYVYILQLYTCQITFEKVLCTKYFMLYVKTVWAHAHLMFKRHT